MGAVRRVLVVDDDDSIREVAEVALGLVGGWDVSTAASGAEGLAQARATAPDVILLDVMMPGMDGPTTLARLRSDPEIGTIPVILLTAKLRPGERRELDDLEVSGVIGKPFDPMTLAGQVGELLGWA
jgi:CheY-like chemotaxis protein